MVLQEQAYRPPEAATSVAPSIYGRIHLSRQATRPSRQRVMVGRTRAGALRPSGRPEHNTAQANPRTGVLCGGSGTSTDVPQALADGLRTTRLPVLRFHA